MFQTYRKIALNNGRWWRWTNLNFHENEKQILTSWHNFWFCRIALYLFSFEYQPMLLCEFQGRMIWFYFHISTVNISAKKPQIMKKFWITVEGEITQPPAHTQPVNHTEFVCGGGWVNYSVIGDFEKLNNLIMLKHIGKQILQS